MDIIDIIIAKSLTPQGQVETYAAKAQKAANDGANAVSEAQEAISAVESVSSQAQETLETANATLEEVDGVLDQVQEALETIQQVDLTTISTEINKLSLDHSTTSTSSSAQFNLVLKYANEVLSTLTNYITLYSSTGSSTTGGMTQAAITYEINRLENEISHSGGGGSINFNSGDEGKIVVVDDNLHAAAGQITEQSIIDLQIAAGTFTPINAYGLEIDYKNKTFSRKYNAITNNDYSIIKPFGGRKRCIVDNNGRIQAFYGDSSYTENYSSGYQVMVYQPKFYYLRMPIQYDTDGTVIKEIIAVSPTEQKGLKLHPAFINDDGDEVEYILLSAYESCAYNPSTGTYFLNDESGVDFTRDYLSSISGVKVLSGYNNNLTVANAEALAANRGIGWHISDIDIESINQMLCSIEFGTLNSQAAIERGICDIPAYNGINGSSITGSTSALGNATGHASSTINEHGGTYETYSIDGKRAISYRGFENPWGNTWTMVRDITITGDGSMNGGTPQINNQSLGFLLPKTSTWIAQFGYNKDYDNIFIPTYSSITANGSLPVGDYCFVTSNLNGIHVLALGGQYSSGDNDGLFYYAADNATNYNGSRYSARLVHIPSKNSVHDANYALWQSKWGGQ